MIPVGLIENALTAAFAEADTEAGTDRGPVIAWALVAARDSDGDEEPEFAVLTADGQRGFTTRGLLADALDAIRIRSLMEACDDDEEEDDQ